MKRLEDKFGEKLKKEIISLYTIEKFSIDDIIKKYKELKLSKTGVNGLLKRSNIKLRNSSEAMKASLVYHLHSGVGKKYSKERIEKMRLKMIGKHPWNYTGHTLEENLRIRSSMEYKKWRFSVFERDGFMCQVCEKIGIYLEAHHIKSFAHFPEERFNLDNGITLCRECHKLTDNYGGRAKGKNNK